MLDKLRLTVLVFGSVLSVAGPFLGMDEVSAGTLSVELLPAQPPSDFLCHLLSGTTSRGRFLEEMSPSHCPNRPLLKAHT